MKHKREKRTGINAAKNLKIQMEKENKKIKEG